MSKQPLARIPAFAASARFNDVRRGHAHAIRRMEARHAR
jgi:hypothetical protein